MTEKNTGKLTLVKKINTYSTIGLIIGILLQIIFPVFKILTIVSSCGLYITILLKNKLQTGKFDIVLCILCSVSLAWVFLREFSTSPYINILGLIIIYCFFIRAFKLSTGQWNKFVLGYGSLTVIISFLNIHLNWIILNIFILLLQFYIIFKVLDPILEKIGQEHRRKRLAHEAEKKRKQELAAEVEKDNEEISQQANLQA